MKRLILPILCLLTFTLASCKKESTTEIIEKNYADDFVGNYDVQYYPHITADLPMVGEQDMNLGPISATAQIIADGDYGDVLVIFTSEDTSDTLSGICYKRGLKLEVQTAVGNNSIPMLGSISFTFILNHPVIAPPKNGVMEWESNTYGSIALITYNVAATGTTRFVATKK